eukprot:5349559-Heterocapsa_arctica.AAC.1
MTNLKAAHLHHASLPERISYLGKTIGDSADKHAKKLEKLKAAHDAHAQGIPDAHEKHASVNKRI